MQSTNSEYGSPHNSYSHNLYLYLFNVILFFMKAKSAEGCIHEFHNDFSTTIDPTGQ